MLRAEDAGVSLPNVLRAESPVSAKDTSRNAYLYCSFAVHPVDLSAATEIVELYATTPGYAEYAIVVTLRSDGTESALAARDNFNDSSSGRPRRSSRSAWTAPR